MRGYRAIALTASVAIFMQFLDATAITTAVPAIARDFGVPAIDMDIAVIAYQLALVVFIPLGGLLAARIGARNAFIAALLIFMTGSILSALSGSLYAMVAARSLQGIGGAIMMPVSRLLVLRSAARSELINALNWLLIPGIIGPLIGPAVGGFLVSYASWRMIFLVNVPIALIGVVATLILVPDLRDEKPEPFDRRGVLFLSGLIVAVILGLGGAVGPRPLWITLAMLACGAVFCVAYVRHCRTAPAPPIDLSLYAIPSFRHSMVAGTMIRVIFGANCFLIPLWLQLAMGMSAAQTGSAMMMMSAGAILVRLLAGSMLRLSHPHSLAMGGGLSFAVALLATALLQPDWPLWAICLLMLSLGITMSIALLVILPVAYVDIPPERLTAATSFYTTIQQLTLSLGVITGVWTIGAMRWFTDADAGDSRAYAGSMVILALLAMWATLVTRRLDRETAAALRPEAIPVEP